MRTDYEIAKYLVENCNEKGFVDAVKFYDDLGIKDFEFNKNGGYDRLVRIGFIAKESDMSRYIVGERAKEYYRSNTP